MNCENLQFNLSLYIDDVLSEDERASIEKHLPTCPLCRQKLSEYKELKNNLRMVARPQIPADLLNSVRSAVAFEINQPTINIGNEIRTSFSDKIAHWLMPYSIGTVAASLFAFVLFSFILTGNSNNSEFIAQNESSENEKSSILLAKGTPDKIRDELFLPEDYERITIADYQPELNPTGALVALTKSIVRGNIKDEEVVIVADVFSNGFARINEVVEPPNNQESMDELQKAFRTNPADAPFLPVKGGTKAGYVQVILKIQRVDVIDPTPKKKVKNKK